jgi:hypothetical protein
MLPPEPDKQSTQTLGAKALRLLTSLLAGLLVGVMSGVLVLVVGGIVLGVFATALGGGESVLNLALLLAEGFFPPAALIITLIVGLIASVIIHKARSRQSSQASRTFTITCLGMVVIGVCLAGLVMVGNLILPRVPAEERAALATLYENTDGDNWRNRQDWLSWWKSPCHWEGVGCYNGGFPTAHVTYLNLRENQLGGNIPSELGHLSDLETLRLDFNQLSGNIPPELGRLSKLQMLSLNHNQLSGGVPPELGNLSDLQELFINHNQLSGSLPLELSNLSDLEYFTFNDTDLCEPAEAAFQEWLAGIRRLKRTDVLCP